MTELQIHQAVVKRLRALAAPGLLWFHVPNDAKRGFKTAARLKSMGMRAGVSDLIAVRNGEIFALELKADGGRPTESQLEFLDDLRTAGGHGVVAEGLDEAINIIKAWGWIR
jgi:hypothetical protein